MRMFQREYGLNDNKRMSKPSVLPDFSTNEDKRSCFYYYGYPKDVAFSNKKPVWDEQTEFSQELLNEEW